MNIFEKATRAKLRFDSRKGAVSVESLWDLPLTQLDEMASVIRREIKELGEDSLLKRSNPKLAQLNLQYELIAHVVEVRLAEKEAADVRAQKAEEKEYIKKILAEREHAELLNAPKEELLAKLNS